jgi:hypothetical protein
MGFEYSSDRSTDLLVDLPGGSLRALAESEDCEKGLIDAPELFGRHVPNKVSKPGGVNGPNLFHQDQRDLTFHVYFGPERRGPGTTRSWCHEDNGPWQEFIGLDDNSITPALLLVPTA